jgi:hypothetical protein
MTARATSDCGRIDPVDTGPAWAAWRVERNAPRVAADSDEYARDGQTIRSGYMQHRSPQCRAMEYGSAVVNGCRNLGMATKTETRLWRAVAIGAVVLDRTDRWEGRAACGAQTT